MLPRTHMGSPYMQFAKLRSGAKYYLATSGIMNYPLAELPVCIEDLEIDGSTIYGYSPLQERLARYTGVSSDCVVAAAGTSMANHLAMAATFEPGDEVLIEHPTYELLESTARYLGARIRHFERHFEEGFQIDPAEVERRITPQTKLILLTNLHNPSGAFADEATVRAVGEIAEAHSARVLVDEVYLETSTADGRGRHFTWEINSWCSLTKAFGLSGLRCGWVLASPELAERMWRINDLYSATPAHPAELLSVVALDHLDKIALALSKYSKQIAQRWTHSSTLELTLTSIIPSTEPSFFPSYARVTSTGLCVCLRISTRPAWFRVATSTCRSIFASASVAIPR